MRKTMIVVILAWMLLIFLVVVAFKTHATSFSYSDPNCISFTMTGSVVTCSTTPPPTCPPPSTGTPPNCVTPPVPTNCQNQGIAVLGGSILSIPWGISQGGVTNPYGAFGNNVAWVFSLSVPPGQQSTTVLGSIQVAENGGQGTQRNVTLSLTPCDFRAYDGTGANGPLAVCRNGTTCGVQWLVGAQGFSAAGLKAGTTYYLNVRNYSDFGGWSCDPGNCPAVYNVQPTH